MRISRIRAVAVFVGSVALIGQRQVSAQDMSHSLELFPSLSIANLGRDLGTGAHPLYSAAALFAATEKFRVGLSVDFASPSSSYDLINTTGSETMQLFAYHTVLAYLVATPFSSLDISVVGTIGVTTLTTDERHISVGGLGSVNVPGRSERHSTVSTGVMASRAFTTHVSVFILSRLLFISPMRTASPGYTIGGGLSIGML